jgi:hypothetical protein
MNRTIATATAGLVAVGTLGLGIGIAGVAGAATPAPSTAPAAHGARTLHPWLKSHRKAVTRAVVRVSATTIGITSATLVAELRAGKSIAQVATEHGIAPATVTTALVTRGEARVTKAESKGRITSAQAAALDAALPRWAAKVVAHQFGHGAKATHVAVATSAV